MSSTSAETTIKDDVISTAVIAAIAERDGVEPTELERPLYDVVDPDALNNLFATDRGVRGHVVFSYEGYEVHVNSEGDVRISDPVDR